jgi:acetyl-CoA acetyltransferase family protein
MARHTVSPAAAQSGLAPELIDEVILGEALSGGGDIARYAAIEVGLIDVAGTAMNRHCASGLAAVSSGAGGIRAGMDRAVVVGGVQSMSLSPRTARRIPGTDEWDEGWMSPSHPISAEAPNMDMSITVGWNAAVRGEVSRAEMDEWALQSHRKAITAIDEGRFVEEIVPYLVHGRDGSQSEFSIDEHPRRETSLERLASLKPLHPEIESFSITAGNSAGVNDGAASMVLASSDLVDGADLEGLATVRSWASVGVDPIETGLAPIKAIPKALRRAGVDLKSVKLFEINEAFASVTVATVKALSIDPDRVNTNGSGCSLGHPIAMTGARMLITLTYELRRRGGGIGVAAMCAGGGMSSAVVIEV